MSGAPRFRPAVPEERPRLDNLFEAVYGPSWRAHTASWRYLPPWDHRGRIWVAECDDRIVGAQPSHAITIRFEGNPIPGALFLDVMTHPEYRRRGVFSGVVEGLRTALHDDGVRVLLTTPNGVAGRGFQSLPAWRPVGELIPFVRLVRWSALLRRPSGGPAPANPDAPGPP